MDLLPQSRKTRLFSLVLILLLLLIVKLSQEPATDFEVDFYGMKYRGNSKNLIDRHVLRMGAYEKFLLYFMRDYVRQLEDHDAVFVDIGANVGQHSLFMSPHVGQVHAFEPYLPVLKRFREMLAYNEIKNVQIHPVGLGAEDTRLPFYEPPESNLGTGSFVSKFTSGNSEMVTLYLDIVRGDSYFKENQMSRVDLVKIDIEGYERLALEGLKDTLTWNRPVVVFEYNPTSEGGFRTNQELISTFPERYSWIYFVFPSSYETGLYAFADLDLTRHLKTPQNMVAYPNERSALIPRSNQPGFAPNDN